MNTRPRAAIVDAQIRKAMPIDWLPDREIPKEIALLSFLFEEYGLAQFHGEVAQQLFSKEFPKLADDGRAFRRLISTGYLIPLEKGEKQKRSRFFGIRLEALKAIGRYRARYYAPHA